MEKHSGLSSSAPHPEHGEVPTSDPQTPLADPKPRMKHAELVKVATRWLTSSMNRCSVVLSEIVTSANCIPDAIGWRYGCRTILVECKVSRSDFFADRDKPSHRAGLVLGAERYYLCPTGVVKSDDVPDPWGLLWAEDGHPGRVRRVKEAAKEDQRSKDACLEEMRLLVSAIRRLNTREFITVVPEASHDQP